MKVRTTWYFDLSEDQDGTILVVQHGSDTVEICSMNSTKEGEITLRLSFAQVRELAYEIRRKVLPSESPAARAREEGSGDD